MKQYLEYGAYRTCGHEPQGEELERLKREIALELSERIMEGHFIIKPTMTGEWTVGAKIKIPEA